MTLHSGDTAPCRMTGVTLHFEDTNPCRMTGVISHSGDTIDGLRTFHSLHMLGSNVIEFEPHHASKTI